MLVKQFVWCGLCVEVCDLGVCLVSFEVWVCLGLFVVILRWVGLGFDVFGL